MQKHSREAFCKKGALKIFANFTGKQLCSSLFLIKLPANKRCFVKKVFLEISQNSPESTSARVCFLKSCRPEAHNFTKNEALAQVLSYEFCEISKNTFFHRTPLVAASGRRCIKMLFLKTL